MEEQDLLLCPACSCRVPRATRCANCGGVLSLAPPDPPSSPLPSPGVRITGVGAGAGSVGHGMEQIIRAGGRRSPSDESDTDVSLGAPDPSAPPCAETAGPEEEASEYEARDFAIEYNNNRLYVESYDGVIDLLVRNRIAEPIDVAIRLDCPFLFEHPLRKRLRVPPKRGRKIGFPFSSTAKAGEKVLDLAVEYRRKNAKLVYGGQEYLFLSRLVKDERNLVVHVTGVGSGAGKVGMGMSQDIRVDLGGLVEKGISEVELQQHRWPDSYRPLRLYLDEEETRSRTKPARPVAAPEGPPMDAALFEREGPGARSRFLLLSRPVLTLGRGRSCDLHLVVGSRTAKNDDLSRMVSRRQARLLVRSEGVFLEDLGSTNGTVLDRERLDGERPRLLGGKSRICIPNSGVELDVRIFMPREATRTARASSFAAVGDAAAAARETGGLIGIGGSCAVEAVRITVLPNRLQEGKPDDSETWVVLIREAKIGRGAANAIVIDAPGVEPIHASLVRRGGRYWLQNLETGGATIVNGRPLEPSEAAPLAPGAEIRFGAARFRFRALR